MPDGAQGKRVFGFEAKMSLEEGLRRTVDWYRAQGPPVRTAAPPVGPRPAA